MTHLTFDVYQTKATVDHRSEAITSLLISWTAKTEFSLGLAKFRILDLNAFIESIVLRSSLKFPHASAQCWKKDDSKGLVLAGKVLSAFCVEDWVKYFL